MEERLIYPTCISSSHLSPIKASIGENVAPDGFYCLILQSSSEGGVFHPTTPRWNECVPWSASGEGRSTPCRVMWPVWWQPGMKNWGRLQSQAAETVSFLWPKLTLTDVKREKWERPVFTKGSKYLSIHSYGDFTHVFPFCEDITSAPRYCSSRLSYEQSTMFVCLCVSDCVCLCDRIAALSLVLTGQEFLFVLFFCNCNFYGCFIFNCFLFSNVEHFYL